MIKYLWHIIDKRSRSDADYHGSEIVSVTINEDPVQVAGIPMQYAERIYMGLDYGQPIVPKTSADNALTEWLRGVWDDKEVSE